MKKIIVALLAVVIIASTLVMCWPMDTQAEEGAPVGTAGATVTETWTGEHKDDAYFEALAVENNASFTKITSYAEFCNITDGSDPNNLAYYYLSLPAGTETLDLTQGTAHLKVRKNIYIDFNGYTVDVSGQNNGVFMCLYDCTVKNLKIVGNLNYVSDKPYYTEMKNDVGQSPLTTHGYPERDPVTDKVTDGTNMYNGVVYLDNILCTVNWTITQQHGFGKYMGGIISETKNGSTISNCVYYGTIVVKNDTDAMAATAGLDDTKRVLAAHVGRIGGIVGDAQGTEFNNCISKGTLTIEKGVILGTGGKDAAQENSGNGGAKIGGIAGHTDQGQLINCENRMDITVKEYARIATDNANITAGHIGGVVGYNDGSTILDGCSNKGTVKNTVNTFHVGGVIGYATAATAIRNCLNCAEGVVDSYASRTQGDMRGIGGVAGYVVNVSSITNCQNDGTVKQSVADANDTTVSDEEKTSAIRVYVGGIVGRFFSSNNSEKIIENCLNKGAVIGHDTAVYRETGAGAILGTLQSEDTNNAGSVLTISNCINDASGSVSGRFVGGIMGTCYPVGETATTEITISGCKNYGSVKATYTYNNPEITTDTNGGLTSIAGGILGQDFGIATARAINIIDCANYGSVDAAQTATGTITAPATLTLKSSSGGIVGELPRNTNFVNTRNEEGANVSATRNDQLTKINVQVDEKTTIKPTVNLVSAAGGVIGATKLEPIIRPETTISGLTNNGDVTGGRYTGGIMGWTDTPITFENCQNNGNVKNGASSGGIIGYVANTATFHNCKVGNESLKNKISVSTGPSGAEDGLGGIVGYVTSDVKIENCENYASLSTVSGLNQTSKYVGGIIGRAATSAIIGYDLDDTSLFSTDKNVGNYGNITVKGVYNQDHTQYVGGIIGEAVTGLKVAKCINKGDIEIQKSYMDPSFSKQNHDTIGAIGGIVGVPYDANGVTLYIYSCSNYGDIIYSANYECTHAAGGMVGKLFPKDKTGGMVMEGCSNYGDIRTTTAEPFEYAGGLIGYTDGGAISVTASHNNGDVAALRHAGGLIGYSYGKPTVTNCTSGMNKDYPVTITVKGTLHATGDAFVGGIMGRGCGAPIVRNCTAGGDIKIENWVINGATSGGFVGGITGHSTDGGTYENCVSNVNIDIKSSVQIGGVGGIVGRNSGSTTTLTGCTNNGDISIDAATTFMHTASGTSDAAKKEGYAQGVGGIFGNGGTGGLTLTSCTNTGDIETYTHTTAGGLAGYICEGNVTITNCLNDGNVLVKTAAPGGYGVGGALGFTSKNATVSGCVNNGTVAVSGTYHTGGIAGYVLGKKIFTDCENNGDIEFKENTAHTNMLGIGGILGYGETDGTLEATNTASISYCVNNGDIYQPADATGSNTHFGGIVGRFANPTHFIIDYCQNNGDITAKTASTSHVGGILGLHQNWAETSKLTDTYIIRNSTNTGTLSGSRVGGMIGKFESGGDGAKTFYATITLRNCLNAGDISAVTHGNGMVGWHTNGSKTGVAYHVTYFVYDCANTGNFLKGDWVAGVSCQSTNAEFNINGFISAGKFHSSAKEAYTIVPHPGDGNRYADSITNVSYLTGIDNSKTFNEYNAVVKTASEIESMLRGSTAKYVVFDRDDIIFLYQLAKNKDSHAGFETQLSTIEKIAIRTSTREYFTTTQYDADRAYLALYNILYPQSFESTFTVALPAKASLTEGLNVSASLVSAPKATLSLTVTQAGIAVGENFKLYMAGDQNYAIEFCFVDEKGDEYANGATLIDIGWQGKQGLYHFDTVTKVDSTYPGKYSAMLTFTVNFDEGT